MTGTGEIFRYWGCSSCGCLQLIDPPEDLSRYYGAGYYSFARPSVWSQRFRRAWLRGVLTGNSLYGSVLRRLLGQPSWLPWIEEARISPEARILDVGSGGGRRLVDMATAGFANVTGLDPYVKGDPELPSGVQLLTSQLEEVTGEFDLIMFNHSLEHMADPVAALRAAVRLLTEDGVILVRVPLVSLAWDVYGDSWVQLDPPRHLYLHTEKSIATAATAAGLRVTKVVFDSNEFQFWGSELYERGVPLTAMPWHRRELPLRALRWRDRHLRRAARSLNQDQLGDQAAFYLKHSARPPRCDEEVAG